MKYKESNDVFVLEVRTDEDLWYTSLIINAGDIILADVWRRVEKKADSIRSKKTEREKVSVRLEVESIEFMELSGRIHILGLIAGGDEELLGEHQSIDIKQGDFIRLIPKDRSVLLKELDESNDLKEESALVLSISDEDISLYLVDETRNSLEWKFETAHGKMYKSQDENYMEKLLKFLAPQQGNNLFIIGPSLFRDSLSKTLAKRGFEVINTQISGSGEEGIRELMQSDILNLRRSLENRLVSRFLKGIHDELSVYGIKNVESALEMKSVEILMLTDRFFRERDSLQLMKKCRDGACKPFIVHSSWETGKVITSYGGAVCLLRYRIGA